MPQQQGSPSLLATTINFINQILVKIYLPGLAATISLCILDMLAVGSAEANTNITFAFFLSMTALFVASTWIAAVITFVWTVPHLATAFISITTTWPSGASSGQARWSLLRGAFDTAL